MNNKMSANTHLSTVESKNQTQLTRGWRENHGYGKCFDGCQMGEGCGEWVKRFGDKELQIGSYRIGMWEYEVQNRME